MLEEGFPSGVDVVGEVFDLGEEGDGGGSVEFEDCVDLVLGAEGRFEFQEGGSRWEDGIVSTDYVGGEVAAGDFGQDDGREGLFGPFGGAVEDEVDSFEEGARAGCESDAVACVVEDLLDEVVGSVVIAVGGWAPVEASLVLTGPV